MNASEFFNANVFHYFSCGDGRYGDWTKSYWDLEFVTAELNGCAFTKLDEWGEAISRTCDVCGAENHTNEYGFVPFCSDATCSDVRSYFGFTSGKRPHLANGRKGSERDKRVTWLRRKLKDLYDVNSIYHSDEIPKDCRLPLLMSMMIAREQLEHNRIEGVSTETNRCSQITQKHREQAKDEATA